MNVRCKTAETINEFIDAIRIRVDVFVKEQNFEPGWEPDEDDKVSKNFIVLMDGKIIATARFREISKGEIKIERMAVLKEYRLKGIGKELLKFIVEEIKKLNAQKIWLRSQVQSQPFYEKCGFEPISEPYNEFGFPHIDMELK